ncbi:hypothetical protein ACWD0Y_35670, partial [Streptomyces altiplanensis]
ETSNTSLNGTGASRVAGGHPITRPVATLKTLTISGDATGSTFVGGQTACTATTNSAGKATAPTLTAGSADTGSFTVTVKPTNGNSQAPSITFAPQVKKALGPTGRNIRVTFTDTTGHEGITLRIIRGQLDFTLESGQTKEFIIQEGVPYQTVISFNDSTNIDGSVYFTYDTTKKHANIDHNATQPPIQGKEKLHWADTSRTNEFSATWKKA